MNDTNTKLSQNECYRYLKQLAFGALVTQDFQVSYVPFVLLDENTLLFHLAKNNPQLQALDHQRCLLTVLGPHAYISSYAYATQPQVPTWNYLSINVKGRSLIIDESQTLCYMDRFLSEFEPRLLDDKERLPKAYKIQLAQYVQCVKLEVTEIEGKAKLGQHKSIEDQESVLSALSDVAYQAYVALVKAHLAR